jgi:glycosyltransferase involved in cell wall biosynthesis
LNISFSNLKFVGWVSEDLPNFLQKIDLLINPSLRGWSETFCISNIEAMSMGIPIVTFGVGGFLFVYYY